MDHPTRTLIFDNNLAYPHLSDGTKKVSNKVFAPTYGPKLTRNDSKFDAPVFLPGNALRFLHKERSEALWVGGVVHLSNVKTWRVKKTFAYLMLELGWVSSMHRHSGAIYMEFPHDTRPTFRPAFLHKLWAKCALFGALP